ncbi:MAG: PQQ-binding-like beta-propeller repeat protein, partial [Candidatus Daviesbacteria bacterium]
MEEHHHHHQPSKFENFLTSWKKKKIFLGFILVGILSLAWLIYKTGTKPSRINYPCQKAAATNSAIFLGWVASILTGHFLFIRLKKHFTWARIFVLLIIIGLVVVGAKEYQAFQVNQVWAQLSSDSPMGTPQGVQPGRVVWVHDSKATTGTYTNYWTQVDQIVVNSMMDSAVKTLTGQSSVDGAMAKIFTTDCSKKKIAIKVNFNNIGRDQQTMDANHQPVIAFLRELTTSVSGIFTPFDQANIYVYDVSRNFGVAQRDYFASAIKSAFPNVHLVGSSASGQVEGATFSTEKFSLDPTYCTPSGWGTEVANFLKDADYLVDMPLLKGHGMSGGSTLSFKNHLGSIANAAAFHPCLVFQNNNPGLVGVYTASFHNTDGTLTSIDKKTKLVIGDALYGHPGANTDPPRNWRIFGNNSPNSLFVSQDVVAADSVMFDTIMRETGGYQTVGQQHLEAAAQRSAGSLGVHEHPNQTGKCTSADNLNCWSYRGTSGQGIDFVNCDAQGTPDSRCVLGTSTGGATFALQSSQTSYTTNDEIPVEVVMRSDTDAANVFSAQLNFPAASLEVARIETTGSFVSLWTDNFYDNAVGRVSLIGSVPTPGYKTAGSGTLMATIVFRTKVGGSAAISFDNASQILRNSDNANILSSTNSLTLSITVAPTPTPTTVPCNLTTASWSTQSTTEGTNVNLNVSGDNANGCSGRQVAFEVRRNGTLLDDISANTQPSGITLNSSGIGLGAWVTERKPLILGTDAQYYFKATVSGGNTLESNPRLLTVTSAITPTPTPVLANPTLPNDWVMAGANPQRTSWVTSTTENQTEIKGALRPEWYVPVEPFIHPKFQIIAAYDTIYSSTAKGLYAFNAATGASKWVYPTELPLGNSPTIYDGVAYVGGLDHKIHAVNALTGQGLWTYEAGQGFDTNPLIVSGALYAGNRDGNMYALDVTDSTNTTKSRLKWKYQTGGPINYSAASKPDNSVIYFASDDANGYALNTNTGTLVWKQKLPGGYFGSWWPVYYHHPTEGDYVIFSGNFNHRAGV